MSVLHLLLCDMLGVHRYVFLLLPAMGMNGHGSAWCSVPYLQHASVGSGHPLLLAPLPLLQRPEEELVAAASQVHALKRISTADEQVRALPRRCQAQQTLNLTNPKPSTYAGASDDAQRAYCYICTWTSMTSASCRSPQQSCARSAHSALRMHFAGSGDCVPGIGGCRLHHWRQRLGRWQPVAGTRGNTDISMTALVERNEDKVVRGLAFAVMLLQYDRNFTSWPSTGSACLLSL